MCCAILGFMAVFVAVMMALGALGQIGIERTEGYKEEQRRKGKR